MPKNEKILIVDDSPINFDFLLEILQNYDVRVAMSAEEAEGLIAEETPDLILLDINMPDKDGYTFCKEIKASQRSRNIPVIFLSARSEGEDVAHGFKVGGADFISKPFQGEVVLARVKTQLRLYRMEQRYQEMLRRDDLTGLLKRTLFAQQAEQWMTHAAAKQHKLGVIAIGLGNLETINRQFGFVAGDEAIKMMGAVLKTHQDKTTMTTRWGGGLFIILKYGMIREEVRPLGLKINKQMQEISLQKYPALRVISEYNTADSDMASRIQDIIELAVKGLSVFPSEF